MIQLSVLFLGILFISSSTLLSEEQCQEHMETQAGCIRYEQVDAYNAQEKVWILPHIPPVSYESLNEDIQKDDVKDEIELFNLDFNKSNIALCPKLKSTSPGTYVLESSNYFRSLDDAKTLIEQKFVEEIFCPGKVEASILARQIRKLNKERIKAVRDKKDDLVAELEGKIEIKKGQLNIVLQRINLFQSEESGSFLLIPLEKQKLKKLAKYKVTMNERDTSGTYAPSNLIYYQFSRFLKTRVGVPVSVYREVQATHHRVRVAENGEKLARKLKENVSKSYRQLYNGWKRLRAAEENPGTYFMKKNIFSSENEENIWGILIKDKGDRYPHHSKSRNSLNGILPSKPGYDARQVAFMNSTPFKALRGEIDWKSFATPLERLQYQYWMQELSEIVILDFIFSQQDRVGNIDYRDYIYYLEDNSLGKKKINKWNKFKAKNESVIELGKIRRTFLNDNDAGVRLAYSNFSKKNNFPGLIRHMDHRFLARLIYLNNSLKDAESSQYKYLLKNFVEPGLISQREFKQIGKNLDMMLFGSSRIKTNLSKTCDEIIFDVDPESFAKQMVNNNHNDLIQTSEVNVNCEKLFSGSSEDEYIIIE
ncbi:hypothetical protein N9N67_02300 [Bacteriovoracaceae bacterium]|nr:hypothetical protein [Bacteriovoracaceae bacterium]